MEKNDIPTEHEEQREFVKWFRQHCKGVRIIAIPYLRNIGYLVLVCKGAEVAKEHILEFCNEEE